MSEKDFRLIFSNNLKRYLQEKDMPQAKLAELLNVGPTSVYNWANGIKIPRMDKVDAMCVIFGCKRSDLIEDHTSIPDNADTYERALDFYARYEKASPEIKAAIETLLKTTVKTEE